MIALVLSFALLATEPKAVIEAPAAAPAGAAVPLRGDHSSSDLPLQWRVLGSEDQFLATFDKGPRANVLALFVPAKPGTYRIALVAVGLDRPSGSDAGSPPTVSVDVAIHEVAVGVAPGPVPPGPVPPGPVPPDPTPNPPPDPTTPVGMGATYGRGLPLAAAVTLDAAADGTWATTGELAGSIRKEFSGQLARAWAPLAAEMTRRFGVVSDVPVSDDQRAQIRAFLKQASSGMRELAR